MTQMSAYQQSEVKPSAQFYGHLHMLLQSVDGLYIRLWLSIGPIGAKVREVYPEPGGCSQALQDPDHTCELSKVSVYWQSSEDMLWHMCDPSANTALLLVGAFASCLQC